MNFNNFNGPQNFGFKFRNAYDMFKDFMHEGFFDEEDLEFFGFKNKTKKGAFDAFDDNDFFSKGFGKNGNLGNFGTSKSVTTSTQIINGKRVSITKTVTKDPQGKITEEIKEETEEPNGKKQLKHYVNGQPVTKAINQ